VPDLPTLPLLLLRTGCPEAGAAAIHTTDQRARHPASRRSSGRSRRTGQPGATAPARLPARSGIDAGAGTPAPVRSSHLTSWCPTRSSAQEPSRFADDVSGHTGPGSGIAVAGLPPASIIDARAIAVRALALRNDVPRTLFFIWICSFECSPGGAPDSSSAPGPVHARLMRGIHWVSAPLTRPHGGRMVAMWGSLSSVR
jgi:hypothetical protein